jgi:CRP-like cAMP-binding protein
MVLLRYIQVFICQVTHTAISSARSTIEERLARWILMAHDRLDVFELPLTHQFLSGMLGVRRAGVTDAIHALQNQGLIRTERGHIAVIDRKGLVQRTNGHYGQAEEEHRQLFPTLFTPLPER